MPEGQLMPWHKTYLVNPAYERVDFVKEGANSQAHIKLFKSKGGQPMNLQEILKKLHPEHAAVITAALAAKDTEMAEAVAKAKKDAEEEAEAKNAKLPTEEEDILKSVKDPAVKALLETQIAKTRAAETALIQANTIALEAEAVAKAKEAGNLGVEEAQMATIYKSLKNHDATLCDEVFAIFKTASAIAGQSPVFKELGSSTTPAGTGSEADAWDKIEKAADAIAKSASISKSAAITRAINENPALYEEYLNAQRG